MEIQTILEILRIVPGALGAWYLYREVKISHNVEAAKIFLESSDTKIIEKLARLLETDLKEYLIHRTAFGMNMDVDEVRKIYKDSPDEEVKKLVGGHHDNFQIVLAAKKNELLKKYTSTGGLKRRKIFLMLGIVLILTSCAIDLFLRLYFAS